MCRRLLSRRLDRALEQASAEAVSQHLAGCAGCAAFDRALVTGQGLLAAVAGEPPGGRSAAVAGELRGDASHACRDLRDSAARGAPAADPGADAVPAGLADRAVRAAWARELEGQRVATVADRVVGVGRAGVVAAGAVALIVAAAALLRQAAAEPEAVPTSTFADLPGPTFLPDFAGEVPEPATALIAPGLQAGAWPASGGPLDIVSGSEGAP